MIIKNTEVFNLMRAIKASYNPMSVGEIDTADVSDITDEVIKSRAKLGRAKNGSGHDNFLKGIMVCFDIKYSMKWTTQAQRYHWLDIISSQSKMHRLVKMAEQGLEEFKKCFADGTNAESINNCWKLLIDFSEYQFADKEELRAMFEMAVNSLPAGFEMWETISTNYLQLKTIYFQRKNHKLGEWRQFCEWIEGLPYFKELCIGE